MSKWGYYEAFKRGHVSPQVMHSMPDRYLTRSFMFGYDPSAFTGANGTFPTIPQAPLPIKNLRESWMNQRDMQSTNPNDAVVPDASRDDDEKADRIEEAVHKEGGQMKKRRGRGAAVAASPKAKKPRKPKDVSNAPVQRSKPNKILEIVVNGIKLNIAGLPIPVCSCTGAPQQCYRWGCGGWQSSCCTTNVSMYPLPPNLKKPGTRIPGRKMSQGAFKKILEKLTVEGYDFTIPIDLRAYWARHGTNKFVTIR